MTGEEVKTPADYTQFWAERLDLLNGEKPFKRVSQADAIEALRRTINVGTRESIFELNGKNFAANRERLKTGLGIREIDDLHQGEPAFIVAAGPSLDKNVEQLVRVQGRFPIFAVDAAYPILRSHGIDPDYVVILDGKPCQKRFLECAPADTKTVLLALPCSHPDVLSAWQGKILFYNSWGDEDDHKIQLEYGQDFGSVGVGGNVSTATLWIASIFCGASPLVLVGHDFSYVGRYYAKGGIDDLAANKLKRPTWDIYGETVWSDLSMWSYKAYTEGMVQQDLAPNGFRVINATEGGVLGTTEVHGQLMPEFEFSPLARVIDELLASDPSVGSLAREAPEQGAEQKKTVAA